MAQMAATLNPAPSMRNRALWVPREHGAWGMLLVPLATGAAVAAGSGGDYVALTVFTVAALALFWLRTPVESLLGTSAIRARDAEERRVAVKAVGIISAIAIVALAELFWGFQHVGLVGIGGVAGFAFVAQALLKKRGRNYRAIAQVIGTIGLTSTAASAYYVVAGRVDRVALVLWAMNWLFAAEQIEFVQMRIRGSRLESARERLSNGTSYVVALAVIFATLVLLSLTRVTPALVIAAFTPAIVRAAIWFTSTRKPLDVHKLGWMELTNSAVFAVIVVTVFRMA